jgi:hypothetical protein
LVATNLLEYGLPSKVSSAHEKGYEVSANQNPISGSANASIERESLVDIFIEHSPAMFDRHVC